MKFDVNKANHILNILGRNSNVNYDYGHMKYTIEFDLNEHIYKEFYNEDEYNCLMEFILKIVEINIWNIHNIKVYSKNNNLIFLLGEEIIDFNKIDKIHVDDKNLIISKIINSISEMNSKSKNVSDLIYKYDDNVTSNDKIIKDIEELKELNKTITGKYSLLKLSLRKNFNFYKGLEKPNREKIMQDLYDVVRLFISDESEYKETIINFFNNMKKNIEKGIVYLFDYKKFENNFSSSDIFLLNKILEIIKYLLDMTDNVVGNNILYISSQNKQIKSITEEIKNSNFITLLSNINNYMIDKRESISFKELDTKIIDPDNNLKYILKMYKDINYIK